MIISKYIHLYDTNRKVLLLEADDEEIYRFITEGIPALMEVANVHVSDRLQRIGIATAPQVSIGVRLVSDLLELKIEPGEFPTEELLNALSIQKTGNSTGCPTAVSQAGGQCAEHLAQQPTAWS